MLFRSQGRSLLDLIVGAPGRPAVLSRTVWDRPRYSLRDERYKFIDDTRTGEEQLYDLQADPEERRNLTATDPLRTAYYREALQHWTLGLARPEATGAAGRALTRVQCENLKSLGDRSSEKELRERFVRTLNSQEDRLERLEPEIKQQIQTRDELRGRIEPLLAKLEYEADV